MKEIHKGAGLVKEVFVETDLNRLEGRNCIGYVRYPTTDLYGHDEVYNNCL